MDKSSTTLEALFWDMERAMVKCMSYHTFWNYKALIPEVSNGSNITSLQWDMLYNVYFNE
jgi:hypothetical protein